MRYLIIATIFAVLGISVLCLFFVLGGDFAESILPEIFGFTLEGFILVALFGLYEHTRQRKSKREVKENIIAGFGGTLLQILNPHSQSFDYSAPSVGKILDEHCNAIDDILSIVTHEEFSMDDLNLDTLRKYLSMPSTIDHFLEKKMPVLMIDHNHHVVYGRILKAFNDFLDTTDPMFASSAIISMLQEMKKFCELDFE